MNCIHKENKMTIRKNRYFMLKELLHVASECGKSVDPIKVAQLLIVPKYKLVVEIFDENTKGD